MVIEICEQRCWSRSSFRFLTQRSRNYPVLNGGRIRSLLGGPLDNHPALRVQGDVDLLGRFDGLAIFGRCYLLFRITFICQRTLRVTRIVVREWTPSTIGPGPTFGLGTAFAIIQGIAIRRSQMITRRHLSRFCMSRRNQ